MPNFSKDRSGFQMNNPMDKTEAKGKSSELPGMIGMRSDNPSPMKFFGKIFKGAKAMLPGGGGVKNLLKGKMPGGGNLPGMGGGALEARVSALEAKSGGGGAAGAMEAAQAAVAPEEQVA
tara:strand:+ start:529 stop:888 length:360 start_codon:yes stop_codon:yes gene_type:complete